MRGGSGSPTAVESRNRRSPTSVADPHKQAQWDDDLMQGDPRHGGKGTVQFPAPGFVPGPSGSSRTVVVSTILRTSAFFDPKSRA